MESEEEDGKGNPGVSLDVAGVEGTLVGRLVNLCIEVNELVRKERLSVTLRQKMINQLTKSQRRVVLVVCIQYRLD